MMVLTRALIKESEERSVKNGGLSFCELMGAAGKRTAEIINEKFGAANKKILAVCGNGNNGGDGFAAAEILRELGAQVDIILPLGEPKTENAVHYFSRLDKSLIKKEIKGEYDIIIDALFGIGLNRGITGETADIIKKLNSMDAKRVSVDIPSGVMCDNGDIPGEAVNADVTVTFIALKPCFLLPEGSDFCGETVVGDIGVSPVEYDYLTTEKPVFPKRRHNSHKGSYGTALLICGSYGMAGAAVLSARAALRSGTGIVKAVIADSIYGGFTAACPEVVCVPVKTGRDGSPDSGDEKIYGSLEACRAVLLGCGLGNTDDTRRILEKIIKLNDKPIVIDADGINALSRGINIIREAKAPVILTPHPGEMARLFGTDTADIERDRIGYAKRLSQKYGCVTVLKGANTIIASRDGEVVFNTTGNPGMAKGGSGDVLSGIIVSLLCQGFSPFEAAKAAVYLHGEAGDRAAAVHGQRGMLPTDIIEEL